MKELLVISQDTSAYGVDLKYATGFWGGRPVQGTLHRPGARARQLGAWVRLHYVYPYPHVDEVIPLMAEGKVLPYLDIPFQHASPRMLKLMKRPAHAENTLERIHRWRECARTSRCAAPSSSASPARPKQDFELLLDWLREARLDRVGCFKYSPVEGAAANALPDPVPEDVKEERHARFMEARAEISAAKLAAKVGRRMRVLVDTRRRTTARSRARRATRRRSTASCASPGRRSSSPATGPTSRSPAPMPTT